MKKTTCFRRLILDRQILKMPCVHDGLAAKIAERTGFSSVCVGGYGASASLLGKPDIGLLSMTEMADHVWRISDSIDIPVFADGDTGHGNTSNVARTIKAFEKAGAAGLFIEDQVFPKRCGHMDGKTVVDKEEIISKIKAAVDARQDSEFVIMGRTDALAVYGLDNAIERGQMMLDAGADMIFVEAPQTVEQMQEINRQILAPTFAVYLEGGKTPLLSADEFEQIGYNVVAYGCSSVYAAAFALTKVFGEIFETGTTQNSQKKMITFSDFNELLELSNIRKKEKSF